MNERLLSPILSDLHLLTVLAATRSYTMAAKRLGISKASASIRISELERAAGVPLVRRTSRSVALTDAGHALVEDIEASFARIEQGFTHARDAAGAPRGVLRVTAPVALGRQRVMPWVPEFLKTYPDIRLELELTDRLVNLQQEGFDIAIRHTQQPPDTHVAWTLCASQAVLVASKDYLSRHGAPTHPSELIAHDCLCYLRSGAPHWSFLPTTARKKAEQRVDVTINGSFKTNNSELLREAAIAGLGIALLPDFSCDAALREKKMVRLLPEWQSVGTFGEHIYAIRPHIAARVPRAVQLLIEYLRQKFSQSTARVSR
jgi:DNA-binding transcriptional LysR family regulator